MGLSESVDGIIGEMIAVKQILRKTAPEHRLSEIDRKKFEEAVARSEALLRRMKEEAGVI
ncbi:MAG: hypothetical protein H5T33_02015 [Candidatus Methanosuratus sp.]|nr:hypothetical protein [Candidatus Methanosuratincola sp.]